MSAEAELDEMSRLRVPPHNAEAEQSLLGSLLVDNSAWDRVGDMLTESAFYRHEHRLTFAAIAGLINACKPADPITVYAALRGEGPKLDYLQALSQCVPSSRNARRYAELIVECATDRSIIAASDEAASLAFRREGDSASRLDKVATLFRALAGKSIGHGPRSLADLMVERLDHLTAVHEGGEDVTAWPTPLPSLNRMLAGGFRPGRVYVLAARPSVGKSALAQALGLGFAAAGHPVLFLSQEMPDGEVADRILSALSRVDFGNLQTAQLSDDEWGRLSEGVETAGRLPFFVDDQASLTVSQIRAKARSVRGLRVLIVDYLQLTASNETSGRGMPNRNAEIEEVSRGLKSLAKQLKCAVLLLSQLNREVEKRPGKKPVLSDLRDSGAIEQDADVVMLMWQLQYPATDGCTMLGIDVAKNRGGEKGDFPLCFWGRHMRFGEAGLPMSHYTTKPSSGGGEI